MYSPQPVSKKPPGVLKYTSSETRDTSQHSIPSFQSFIKSTPPLQDAQKPLPPNPPANSTTADQETSQLRRRSSSVYSRVIDQWAATPESWTSSPMSSPIKSSASTHQYSLDNGEILQPTVFRPAKPEWDNGHDSGIQLSTFKPVSESSFDKPEDVKVGPNEKTVTLLLPEEWRQKAANNKSIHSDISNHKDTSDEDDEALKSPGSVRFDLQNMVAYAKQKPLNMPQTSYSDPYLRYADAYRKDSDSSLLSYEARGRTTSRQYSAPQTPIRYGPPNEDGALAPRVPSEAERLAHMYHAVLRDQSLHSSRNSSTYSRSDSPDTRTHMKMIPQPLFHNPRTISDHRAREYSAPRFNNASPGSSGARSILKNGSSAPIATQEIRSKKPLLPGIMATASRHNIDFSDLSPRSDKSDTPILGRFASLPKVRNSSPHLHSPTKITHSNSGTFATMKDMVSSLPSRRLSLHMPAAVKNVHIDTEKVKETLGKVGTMLESKEKKREKEKEQRKKDLKRMIRVIPNE
ncbi:hypothetical protein BDZ85DRAFT_283111 [Elsinoe ampelina]|uniref:Uncharacterized protein n=1 Tax=Elsinoe ampelina TaxID=302913 RepID=A0A6A6G885_9PEZI|nr:hypothetical protein BDZ85DRAFT_283111 [Elsinoe ampelina]